MQKVDFTIHSEVEGNHQLDQHWDDDFKAMMTLFSRIELTRNIYNSGGLSTNLVRFKNGGYAYYECYELDGEEIKKVFFEGKEIYIQKTGRIHFYISNNLEELKSKFELSEAIIETIKRKEDYVA